MGREYSPNGGNNIQLRAWWENLGKCPIGVRTEGKVCLRWNLSKQSKKKRSGCNWIRIVPSD